MAYRAAVVGASGYTGVEALRLLAATEGILLDPVYTAKAMAALMHDAREGRLGRNDTVVFLHTGGLPAVFAYRDGYVSIPQGPGLGIEINEEFVQRRAAEGQDGRARDRQTRGPSHLKKQAGNSRPE